MTSASNVIDPFMAEIELICLADRRLTPLGGGILAGIDFDIAHDSRGFAKLVGVEHALVLREVQALVDLRRLMITKRDVRTQRCYYQRAIDGSESSVFSGAIDRVVAIAV